MEFNLNNLRGQSTDTLQATRLAVQQEIERLRGVILTLNDEIEPRLREEVLRRKLGDLTPEDMAFLKSLAQTTSPDSVESQSIVSELGN